MEPLTAQEAADSPVENPQEATEEDDRVTALLAKSIDVPIFADAVEAQEAPDAADTLEGLGTVQAAEVIEEMETESAAEALAHMHPSLAVSVLEDLIEEDPSYAGKLIEEMAPDDATDLLQNLPDDYRDRLLGTLGKVEAVKMRELLSFDEESAGGMMTTDYLAVRDTMTVAQAVEAIRRADTEEEWVYVFVVDWRGRLQGRVTMKRLLLAEAAQKVIDVCDRPVDAVPHELAKEDVAREFEKYDYLVLPVVDATDRLLGVITVDDVVDIIRQESTEDAQKMVGAGSEEAVFSSVAEKLRGRFPWLVLNLLTSSIAATVVFQFDDLIGSIAILAVIMPLIANQSGNAGQQSLAVTLRGIVLDEVRPGAALTIVRREAMVGAVNGLLCGVLVGTAVGILEHFLHPASQGWRLGLIVGISMPVALTIGTTVGASLPLIVRRLGADPATASTIFLTMVTDSVSFFVFLGLASLLQSWIQVGAA